MPATRGARFCGCNSQKQQNNQIAPSLDDIRSVALPPPSPPWSVLPACPLGACCPCWLCWSLLPCRVWLSVFPPIKKRAGSFRRSESSAVEGILQFSVHSRRADKMQ